MQTKPYSIQAPEDIAKEYGGNKQAIAQAAQNGLLDPTAAVLAGMFIDRMRNAIVQEQVPQQTVAQQVFAPPAPPMPPAGLGGTPEAQQMAMAAPPAMPPEMAGAMPAMAGGGLADLPVDESMFPDEYASGGIVAFAHGGDIPRYQTGNLVRFPSFDQLPAAPKNLRSGDGFAYESVMPSLSTTERRIDPVTGMPVTLGEYLRLTEQRRASGKDLPSAQPSAAPAVASSIPAVSSVYPDETARGTAKSILAGDIRSKDFFPPAAAEPQAPAAGGTASEARPAGMTVQQFRDMQQKFGLTPAAELFAADREANAALRSQLSQDRETAKNMALIEAGLGIMGGSSPYAFKNIGEGAKSAISSYSRAVRDIKADEKEYAKIDRDIRKAEEALRRGDFDSYVNMQEKAEDRVLKLRTVEAQEKAANRAGPAMEVINALAGGKKDPASIQAAARTYLGTGKTGTMTYEDAVKQVLDKQPYLLNKGREQEFKDAIQRILSGQESTLPGVRLLNVRPN